MQQLQELQSLMIFMFIPNMPLVIFGDRVRVLLSHWVGFTTGFPACLCKSHGARDSLIHALKASFVGPSYKGEKKKGWSQRTEWFGLEGT